MSLTGDFSGDGKALVQGYDLWAQDENAKGGLLGHHVTMKYVDDASSTPQVVTNYQNLITQDKVALVFGPFSSLLTIPASTVTDRFGYAFPEPAGGGPSVFNRGMHSLFFVQPAPVEDNLVSFTQWVLSLPGGPASGDGRVRHRGRPVHPAPGRPRQGAARGRRRQDHRRTRCTRPRRPTGPRSRSR